MHPVFKVDYVYLAKAASYQLKLVEANYKPRDGFERSNLLGGFEEDMELNGAVSETSNPNNDLDGVESFEQSEEAPKPVAKPAPSSSSSSTPAKSSRNAPAKSGRTAPAKRPPPKPVVHQEEDESFE
jgi:hypothetical protein